jgi:hypothetical protein
LAVLLNERSAQWSLENSTRLYTGSDESYYTFVCRRGGQNTPVSFLMKLYPHQRRGLFRIAVTAEINWLLSGEWNRSETSQMTKLKTGGLELKKEKMKVFVRFSLPAPPFATLRSTSQSILRHEPLFALAPTEISP